MQIGHSQDTNICVKTIHWHKLWYNFPEVVQSYSDERAVFFGLFFSKRSVFRNHYLLFSMTLARLRSDSRVWNMLNNELSLAKSSSIGGGNWRGRWCSGGYTPTKFTVAGALFRHSWLINEDATWSSQVTLAIKQTQDKWMSLHLLWVLTVTILMRCWYWANVGWGRSGLE